MKPALLPWLLTFLSIAIVVFVIYNYWNNQLPNKDKETSSFSQKML